MQQQQPPQMSSNPVPDHRLDELNERLRNMELQNQQLRGQIDYMSKVSNPGKKPDETPAFKPEVEAAIMATVQKIVEPLQMQHKQQIGYLVDQLDQTKFQSQYGGERYAKIIPKVERLREQYQAQNQYITREQALQMVWFEETGKKQLNPDPQAAPAPAKMEPKFDPYFGTYVDPQTGKPLTPEQIGALQQPQTPPPQQTQQAPQQTQQPWQPGNQIPGQQAPATQFAQQPPQQNFQLPGQGVNGAAAPSFQNAPRGPLTLEASEQDLKAFEENFGDIPL